MKIHLVDYATPNFYGSREMLHISARHYGVDNIFSYGPNNLSKAFREKNRDILRHSKGAGYWIWKPYIILDALEKIGKDDVLMYSDADQGFVQDAGILARECAELGIGLYISPRVAKVWTKRDCFIIMGCDTPEYHDNFLGLGGFSCWMSNDLCKEILNEWLHYAQDPRINIRDTPNVLGKPNLKGFKRHSTDQSIITMLAIKHGVKRLMPPNIKTTTNFLQFYKNRGIFRKEGKVVTRFGVFGMNGFETVAKKRKIYFDGRQIYFKKTGKAKLWKNPFYGKAK